MCAAATLAACGGAGGDAPAETTDLAAEAEVEPTTTAIGASSRRSAVCDAPRRSNVDLGGPLRARLRIPAGGGDGPWPVVVVLHGAGADADQAALFGFSALGDREGFAALYPSARARSFWSLNREADPDDLPPFRALLDRLAREPCLDRERFFVTGVSNGGGFAARAGCALSGRVRAIAPVAGGYRALDPCRPRRPVNVLEIHGRNDSVVPYFGRPPDRAGSVPRYLRGWARRNGCARRPVTTRSRRLVARQRWRGCRSGGAVEHLRLDRTGHGWPGIFASRPGDPTGVDATREAWRFFERVSAAR